MMAPGKTRCTRRLRSWMVTQVSSGMYRGLVWDDDEKTMFRIPWKHAAKHDFRSEEDAAIFKAWAEFKGKLCVDDSAGPAMWKTRLRCALNKSPEFSEVRERSQLDISEPYKVYRLVPLDEQGQTEVKKEKEVKRSKNRKRRSETETEQEVTRKWIKEESASAVRSITAEVDITTGNDVTRPFKTGRERSGLLKHNGVIDEIQLNVTVETQSELGGGVGDHEENVYPNKSMRECPSFLISVYYVGLEVLRREVRSDDLRIAYDSASLTPPSLNTARFFRVSLPPPLSDLTSNHISSISSLLSFLESGVMLTLTSRGVYAKRYSQGRVFWRGPHSTDHSTRKMERTGKPTLIFDQELFKQDLERFRNGGEKPETEVTLCFGEELLEGDDLTKKLIILKVGLPWAEQQVKLEAERAWSQSVTLLQSLAQQSPSGEITLSLVQVPDASL